MISYGQNWEDVLLERCFSTVTNGFYVDVGAHAPVLDSVTFGFYERGWRGINVEPLAWRYQSLALLRPLDINIQAVCCREAGERTIYVPSGLDGLSSLSEEHLTNICQGRSIEAYNVRATTLAAVLDHHAPAKIHFLKVDVEGAELDVLMGNDWARWRPMVILAEATIPLSRVRASDEVRRYLEEQNYIWVYFDGLNDFYVASEHPNLVAQFDAPPNIFDRAERLTSFGHALERSDHPDHTWALNLARQIIRSGHFLTVDHVYPIVTAGFSSPQLEEEMTQESAAEAYRRVLGRSPSERELSAWFEIGATPLGQFYRYLLNSHEFHIRRARTAASDTIARA